MAIRLILVLLVAALGSATASTAGIHATAQAEGRVPDCARVDGAIVRGPTDARQLALVFTAHEFAEGAPAILGALSQRRIAASFFLTGAFLRAAGNAPTVARMLRDGHYVGPHSDGHLLYAPWTGPKVTLVSREEFTSDLERNLEALAQLGVERRGVRVFLPPYEWYTADIAKWSDAIGLTLINFTSGTRSNADYTEEGTKQFVSSETILQSILRREREDPRGLNGFILLLHLGAGPGRTDKFHLRFEELLTALGSRGYGFTRIDRLIERCDRPSMPLPPAPCCDTIDVP